MRRLLLVLFAVFVVAGVGGVREARAAPYSQVVDNTTKGRFKTVGDWGTSSYGSGIEGENYRFAQPGKRSSPAQFKVRIPATGDYAVYVRWPKVAGLNGSAPIGVRTTSGVAWRKVNQQRDGGRWVKIGVFRMAAGDDYSVWFSRWTNGGGYVAADAVGVERVSPGAAAPSTTSPSESGPTTGTSATGTEGETVVREARTYNGTPYHLGRASRSAVDCAGFTMLVYRKFGISLPHSPTGQYGYGTPVSGPPRAGDLVFFNEHGTGISHVGIATGRGKIIHASDYFNRVVESDMKYIKGYVGARRLL